MYNEKYTFLFIVFLAVFMCGCNKKETADPQQSVNESYAVSELMGIRAQVKTYREKNHAYPETIESMREALGVSGSVLPEVHTFRYEYAQTESGWECYAVPLSRESGTRSFYVSEDNAIRSKEGMHDTEGKEWTTIVQQY